jgi:hypothetical protein
MQSLAADQGLRCVEYETHPYTQQWVLFVPQGVPVKPRVQAVAMEPAGSAEAGSMVKVTVIARAYAAAVDSMELYVNASTDQYANGEWHLISREAPGSSQAVVTFLWDTAGVEPGRHRIGVNVAAGDAAAWWYDHTPVFYDLTPSS